MDSFIEKYTPFILKYKLPLSLGFTGMILFIYGLIASFSGSGANYLTKQNSDGIIFTSGSDSTAGVKSAETKREITVDIAGGVMTPGVYKLPEGSRMDDALMIAGGMSADADRELIARQLNLAAKLADGSKVYIPRAGESTTSSTGTTSTTSLSVSGLINVNSASLSDLDTLSGIGPVTAQKIIDNRPYQTIEDLLNKKAVTNSVFEKIKEKISTY